MKFFLSIAALFVCSALVSQTVFEQLQQLSDNGEYFRMREKFESDSNSLSVTERDFAAARINYLFNQPAASNQRILHLLRDSSIIISDSSKAQLLQTYTFNLFRLFQYRATDSCCRLMLDQYKHVLENGVEDQVKNLENISSALINTPRQEEKSTMISVLDYSTATGAISVPISVNGDEQQFIFDTGASLSAISHSDAIALGLRISDTHFQLSNLATNSVDAVIGVADSFRIGNMTFRNVVFAVFNDDDMDYASALRKIKGVIGWPVISHMGTIQLKGKKMSFPVEDSASSFPNLGLDGNLPFLNVSFFGEYHPYIFDTGSSESLLGKKFLRRYDDSITHATETTITGGTFGQQVKMKVLRVTILDYRIENHTDGLVLANILEEGNVTGEDQFYGLIGGDMIYGWKVGRQTVTMNFNRMYIRVE